MLCFKDKTFCSFICNNFDCSRNFTPAEKEQANKWWDLFKIPDEKPPVAFSNFKDKTGYCKGYISPEIEGKHLEI